jgi:hypothetical protein
MPEIRLQGSGIDTVVGQFVAARMPQHVGVNLDALKLGGLGDPFRWQSCC